MQGPARNGAAEPDRLAGSARDRDFGDSFWVLRAGERRWDTPERAADLRGLFGGNGTHSNA